jgi:hypothetical protein
MSFVTTSSLSVSNVRTPAGPCMAGGYAGGAASLETCDLSTSFVGTYVQGTGFVVQFADVSAALAGSRRDGKTYTILSILASAPGKEGSASAFVMPVNLSAISIGSSTQVTGLLYGPDLATERASGALQGFAENCVFSVSYLTQSGGA